MQLAAFKAQKAKISLTPLIDVVFILLIFFMLASNFLKERALPLESPARTGAGGGNQQALLLRVGPDWLELNGERLSAADLGDAISNTVKAKPEQSIVVLPTEGAKVQRLVTTLDMLKTAGAAKVTLGGSP